MYYLLTDSFKSQEEKLAAMITALLPVDKIFLLASTLTRKRTESVFLPTAPTCQQVSHYHLLVLVPANCGYSNNAAQDIIENTCRSFIPVTCIVLQSVQFYTWLQQGHRFATTVTKIAVAIYAAHPPSPAPSASIFPKEKPEENNTVSNLNMGKEFLAGAELYLVRMQKNMALFMLHQAAEQALQLLLKKGTGLHINTHNLDKLLRYCALVSYRVSNIFPRSNANDERLFQLLQKAYIEVRYKEKMKLKKAELEVIVERVKNLMDLITKLGWDKE